MLTPDDMSTMNMAALRKVRMQESARNVRLFLNTHTPAGYDGWKKVFTTTMPEQVKNIIAAFVTGNNTTLAICCSENDIRQVCCLAAAERLISLGITSSWLWGSVAELVSESSNNFWAIPQQWVTTDLLILDVSPTDMPLPEAAKRNINIIIRNRIDKKKKTILLCSDNPTTQHGKENWGMVNATTIDHMAYNTSWCFANNIAMS